jgi:hypothetical protein
LERAFRYFFYVGCSVTRIIVVFFSVYKLAILRLNILLFYYYSEGFLGYSTVLLAKFFTTGMDDIVFGCCAVGIFGKSFATAGTFTYTFYFYFLSSYVYYFQLFFFLPILGLVNLVFLSALNRL